MECNKCCGGTSVILSVIISIIIGIASGVLFSLELIPITLNFIQIALIISIVAIGILVFTILGVNISRECKLTKCICRAGKMLLIGAIGTLLAGTITVTAGVASISTVSIIFVGLTALFFIWTIIYIIFLIKCLICEICGR